MQHNGFIGVHVGAGHHSKLKTYAYKQLCKVACNEAIRVLNTSQSAVDAVAKAVEILENSPLTNAGYGSSLTEDGTVECDAGIMDGQFLQFGAVGAVSGIHNPIQLAKKLLDEQCNGLRDLGRIPPSILVGPGARKYALKKGVKLCQPHEQITDDALALYRHYQKKLSNQKGSNIKKVRLEDACNILENELLEEVSDTVGAVALDQHGNVAAATSSGGLLLKNPGRVGQAAAYGCGCWAQNKARDQTISIACSTSGCGESLIKTIFAKECIASLLTDGACAVMSLQEFFQKKFLESPFLRDVKEKLAGVVVLKCDSSSGMAEFLWSHTTDSMCIGYQSTSDAKAVARMSRLPENLLTSSTVLIEGTSFNLQLL